jgi:hypothetical protein
LNYDRLIGVGIGLAAVVLPVVGVYALRFIVFSEVEGTELCFVVEHVEIVILDIVVDERGQDLLLAVRV